MKIKLSIIILSWNTKELLRNCLSSIESRPNTEIIVVDNASVDGSAEMVEKYKIQNTKYNIQLIRNQINLGFAKGNNIGIRIAGGEYIMLLNSDTIVQAGAIEELISFLDKESKNVVAVSPLLLNEDGSVQADPCYLKFPSPLTVFLYYNPIFKKIITKFFPRVLFSTVNFSLPSMVEQLPGAAMMFRADVLKKLHGLDEEYSHYFEDVDLSYRAAKKGFKLMVLPDAKITHLGRKSIEPVIKKEGLDKFYLLNFSSLLLFCRKNYPPVKALLIKIIVLTQLALHGRLMLIKKLINR